MFAMSDAVLHLREYRLHVYTIYRAQDRRKMK
jgi:hypothetical protein